MSVRFIHGPIISCESIPAPRALFEGVFGMKVVAQQQLDRTQVKALWGLEGHGAQTVLMETPKTHFGVRLVQFDPISPTVIRSGTPISSQSANMAPGRSPRSSRITSIPASRSSA